LADLSVGHLERHIVYREVPGEDMERYYPRAGVGSLIVAIPVWLGFLINSMLGLFPAIPFHDGGMGVKFHLWYFIQDTMLGGSTKPVWSDAGSITGQELAMLVVALPLTVFAIYCLRKRPEFGGIDTRNMDDERELLEMSVAIANTKGTGDANTAAIIDSVVEGIASIDTNVVNKALGKMEVIAVASAAEVAASAASKAEKAANIEDDATTIDSRFTTIVGDEHTEAMVSAAAAEAKGEEATSDAAADDDTAVELGIDSKFADFHIDDESKSKSEAKSESDEPEIEKKSKMPSLAEISDFAKRQAAKAGSIAKDAAIGVGKTASTVSAIVSEKVESVLPSGKDSRRAKSGEERKMPAPAPPQRRHTVQSGVMPVRPRGLPPMAEWSDDEGMWMLFGRPVRSAELPEPEAPRPAWAVEDDESLFDDEPPVLSATAILVDDLFEVGEDSSLVLAASPIATTSAGVATSSPATSGGLPPLPGSGGSAAKRAPPVLPKIP